MKRLAPDLFDRRFQDLMETGRARLPGLAPEWTDYNAHDPGITLMELLAWVTEAQLYSLARMRRDERTSYAALFGLTAGGTRPAQGLIWPDRLDPHAPSVTFTQSLVIATDAVVNMLSAETPTFRPASKLLWVPGRINRLTAVLADGRTIDYTVINERGMHAFQPFGTVAGNDDRLVIEFACRSEDGLFPIERADADDALWPIGVRADHFLAGRGDSPPNAVLQSADSDRRRPVLAATLVTGNQRIPLPVVTDSSHGLLSTGVLLLNMSAVKGSPRNFAIELRAPGGFERPPRLLRIEPNVIPIVQGRLVTDELHVATGLPDWSFQLALPGLRFAPFETPVKVVVRDPETGRRTEWQPCESLSDHAPDDAVYEFEPTSARITFGNGLNGRIAQSGWNVLASYAVSDGDQGDVAANRAWQIGGFAGAFGINADAVVGGTDAIGWIDLRREARRRARDDHALVSSNDIVAAALALPLLEVARAWLYRATGDMPQTGTITLVAMRARVTQEAIELVPETRRWLDAINRQLAPQILLGTRLVVTAPRYIVFSIQVLLEAVSGRDPAVIRAAVESELLRRFSLVGEAARPPGIPVSKRDITAWIRLVDGVRRSVVLRLAMTSGEDIEEITVPRNGLPRFDISNSTIEVKRAIAGAAP